MNSTLFKALIALFPALLVLFGSLIVFSREKTLFALIQLVGAGGIVLVVITHVCEALDLFPAMHWGLEHSAGHYLDLLGAVLGLTLFPVGYFLHALRPR